jgi:hypothetical protein
VCIIKKKERKKERYDIQRVTEMDALDGWVDGWSPANLALSSGSHPSSWQMNMAMRKARKYKKYYSYLNFWDACFIMILATLSLAFLLLCVYVLLVCRLRRTNPLYLFSIPGLIRVASIGYWIGTTARKYTATLTIHASSDPSN